MPSKLELTACDMEEHLYIYGTLIYICMILTMYHKLSQPVLVYFKKQCLKTND